MTGIGARPTGVEEDLFKGRRLLQKGPGSLSPHQGGPLGNVSHLPHRKGDH